MSEENKQKTEPPAEGTKKEIDDAGLTDALDNAGQERNLSLDDALDASNINMSAIPQPDSLDFGDAITSKAAFSKLYDLVGHKREGLPPAGAEMAAINTVATTYVIHSSSELYPIDRHSSGSMENSHNNEIVVGNPVVTNQEADPSSTASHNTYVNVSEGLSINSAAVHEDTNHDLILNIHGADILVGLPDTSGPVTETAREPFQYTQEHLGQLNVIPDFKAGEDSLDLTDLLAGSGATPETLVSGGYLNCEQVQQNPDGSATLTLSVDPDGYAGNSSPVPLVEMTVMGLNLSGISASYLTAEALQQLIDQNSIIT